ncbi:MAG: hypothetical protein QNJ60_20930 [Xenococcaceae cyanobacterium MO_188.B19]|nr:hypothetical protein [Xenococcaceae cyanobacterium MO_188.B19]
MSTSIIELVDNLPTNNITVKVLKSLDFVLPGKWENLVGFDNTISAVTGVTAAEGIAQIRDRAIELYDDKKNGYQTAIWLYQTVDNADKAIAAAAIADKIGDTFRFIPFLDKLTPKADSVQSIDLRLKLVAELIVYSKINGITLTPVKFAKSLKENYQQEALLRMAALICIDGIIPLGADFVSRVRDDLEQTTNVAEAPAFNVVSDLIPAEDKQGFINESFNAVGDWMDNLTHSFNLNRDTLFNKFGGFIEIADDKLDYVAAFLDSSTNYFEHTGIQTVARRLIKRAHQEMG